MPPQGTKVWNEDLVKALRARAEQKRQQGTQNFITFQNAANTLEDYRKDIYAFKNGRIVNLPQKLSVSIAQLCRDIIAGNQDVLPPGYVPILPEDQVEGNPFANHPYLTRIKIRSGAFAILMAFHLSQRNTMTREEIITAGQRFCDDEMEANYNAGRMYGAWKGNETLKKHGLINVMNGRVEYREGRGFRSLGKSNYELTRDGEKFIEALLDRHPGIRMEVEAARVARPPSGVARRGERYSAKKEYAHMKSTKNNAPRIPSMKSGRLNEHSSKDIEHLRAWASAAAIGNQKSFKVGKQRRSTLHDECDRLNTELSKYGKFLRHESVDVSTRSRELFVTMVAADLQLSSSAQVRASATVVSPPQLKSETPVFGRTGVASPKARRSLFTDEKESPGRCLGGGPSTPPKRARQMMAPAPLAAGAAALQRQAIFESLASAQKQASKQSKQAANDRKMPPRSKLVEVIDLVDSDDDDEATNAKKPPPLPLVTTASAAGCFGGHDVVDLTEPTPKDLKSMFSSSDGLSSQTVRAKSSKTNELTIFVDDRERNRNATPRLMRTELERILSAGILANIRKYFVSNVRVVEKNLKTGDFCFAIGERPIAPPVERKTIGDIVQRSFRKDHWYQLHRMRDSTDGVFFILLEGDFRTAVQFTPYGAQGGEHNSNSHIVDSEESLIRFLGRSILSCKKVRVIQTKDVQGSLRAVGALGLTATTRSSSQEIRATAADARSELSGYFQRLGVPQALAQCIADEVGSKKHLDCLYGSAENDYCRSALLTPIILGCHKGGLSGTAEGWSRAIYTAHSSKLQKKMFVKESFVSLRNLVAAEDQALLLEKLHSSYSREEALDSVLDAKQDQDLPRVVLISVPLEFHTLFPDCHGESVFSVSSYESSDNIPSIIMQTTSGAFCSDSLAIFIMEGNDLVSRLRNSLELCCEPVEAALNAAASIRADCCFSAKYNPIADSCILVIRGLTAAADRWAKTVGYRSEFRALLDLIMSEMSLSHDTVVLQAIRLQEDLELIAQHIALSCYHYQFLTRIDS